MEVEVCRGRCGHRGRVGVVALGTDAALLAGVGGQVDGVQPNEASVMSDSKGLIEDLLLDEDLLAREAARDLEGGAIDRDDVVVTDRSCEVDVESVPQCREVGGEAECFRVTRESLR